MAYATIAGTTASEPSMSPKNVITVSQEKDFVISQLFKGNVDKFYTVNTLMTIYDDNDASIPLTSVIYTPTRKYFENSKLFKQISTTNTLNWLKKRNIIVLVYDVTSYLDVTLETQNLYNDASLIDDIMQTSGCLTSIQSCIPNIFKKDQDIPSNNENLINLFRYEASPFNYRLNTIRDRKKNVYSCNFTIVNNLIFDELNNDKCIQKFLQNTINIKLS